MPQTFQVLKCYKCSIFQVHQRKKSNKFECKLCGEKQSIKRYYGLGNGKECRMHVQKLNGIRGEIENLKNSHTEDTDEDEEDIKVETNNVNDKQTTKESKWLEYVEPVEEPKEPITDESMYLGDQEVVTELPKKHRKFSTKNLFKHRGNDLSSDKVGIGSNNSQSVPYIAKDTWVKDNYSPKDSIEYENVIELKSTREPTLTTVSPSFKDFSPLVSTVEPVQLETKPKLAVKDPPINKKSKWMQFVENSELESSSETCLSQSNVIPERPNAKGLFSLCDDSELDNILNF